MRQAKEISLDTRAGRMALLHWEAREEAAPKVLCLHGWLDNAASFIPLAQHLEGLDLYALDFPGHGHSDHRPPGVRYAFTEYIFDLDAVLDALGWETTSIIGHSMGGGVANMFASVMPERVDRLVLLDGLGPWTIDITKTRKQLRDSLEWVRRPRRPLRRFESLEAVAKARQSGFLEISLPAARMIAKRAARRVVDEDGTHYTWRTDPALRWDSPVFISEEQVMQFLAGIEAPVLSLHAQPWTDQRGPFFGPRQQALKNAVFEDIEGNHHFHMDEAEKIAPKIQAFIEEKT